MAGHLPSSLFLRLRYGHGPMLKENLFHIRDTVLPDPAELEPVSAGGPRRPEVAA